MNCHYCKKDLHSSYNETLSCNNIHCKASLSKYSLVFRSNGNYYIPLIPNLKSEIGYVIGCKSSFTTNVYSMHTSRRVLSAQYIEVKSNQDLISVMRIACKALYNPKYM